MQFAKDADIDIVVNNSSGGRNVDEAYEACVNLHDNIGENSGTNPDMIAIYLGINDYQNKEGYLGSIADINWETLIVKEGDTYSYATPTTFCEAYAILMHKTQTAYADADIFAFTLVPNNTRIARGFDTTMEESVAYLREYNDAIWGLKDELKTRYGIEINIVDLFNNTGITIENFTEYNCDPNAYFTLSSLHPNEAGMDLITECLIDAVIDKYSK